MQRTAGLVFLALSALGLAGWIVTRFTGPILGVSYGGFLLFTLISLAFVVALSLFELAFRPRKTP